MLHGIVKPLSQGEKEERVGHNSHTHTRRYSFHGTVRFRSGHGEASFTYYVHVPFFFFVFVFEASRAMKPRGTHTSERENRRNGRESARL